MWLYDRSLAALQSLEPQKVQPLDLTEARNALRIDTVQKHNLPAPDPDDRGFYSRRFASGGAVFPAVYAAINILASTIARLPKTVAVLRDPIEDEWDSLPDHPVSILMRFPSRQFDPWQYWEWMLRMLFYQGNGYSEVTRINGLPVELIPVMVTNQWFNGQVVRSVQRVLGNQQQRVMKNRWLLSFHGPGFNGIQSPSPVWHYASSVVAMESAAREYNQRSLVMGLSTRTAIEIDPMVGLRTRNQGEALQKRLQKMFSGAMKAGGTPVLPPGAKLHSTQGMLSNIDVDLIEQLKWDVEDVARIWNVPPRLLQHYHEGFRASKDVEAQFEDFERISIQPHVHRLQEQIGNKLLTKEDRSSNRVIRFSTDLLKMGSWSERARSVREAADSGVITANEGRKKLNLRARPDGDKLLERRGAPKDDGSQDLSTEKSE